MASKLLKVRPDSKGRISLGKLAEGVSSYVAFKRGDQIILEPNVEIPAREAWLFKNKTALNQIKKGLQDSASGRVKSRGDFTEFMDDEE